VKSKRTRFDAVGLINPSRKNTKSPKSPGFPRHSKFPTPTGKFPQIEPWVIGVARIFASGVHSIFTSKAGDVF